MGRMEWNDGDGDDEQGLLLVVVTVMAEGRGQHVDEQPLTSR